VLLVAVEQVRAQVRQRGGKMRGVTLGSPKLSRPVRALWRRSGLDQHAANVLPIIREAQRAGASALRQIAEALNARGIRTARGGQYNRPHSPLC
jgi:hypothetical protein